MNKKVLIIFPELKATISRIRLHGIIKFLKYYGWEPVILTNEETPLEEEFDTIFVPYDVDFISNKWKKYLGIKLNKTAPQDIAHKEEIKQKIINRLIYHWQEIFLYPDELKEWRKEAVQAASYYIDKYGVDVVLSSFPPVTPHIIAMDLKKKYNIPWIADMRDLWTDYSYYRYGFLRKSIEKRLESKTLSAADHITTVSKPLENSLQQNFKRVNVIENGFDPDEVNKGTSLSDKFSITHTGQLYDGRRNPELLFKALNELRNERKINLDDFEINFYGDAENWLKKEVQEYKLENVVKIHGRVERKVSLRNQRSSHLLLLIRWDNPHEEGVFTGKIFEYLAAKRPIISIGYVGGVIDELLEKTNTGISLNSVDGIKKEVFRAYSEFKSGQLNYSGIPEEINKYSHKEMANKFANVFNNTLKWK